MLSFLHLIAADPPAQPQGEPPFNPLFMMLMIGVAFMFIMYLPMRKQQKQQAALLSALKKNDEVVTSAGIIGIVHSLKENKDEVTLKVDDNTNMRIRVTKSSIVRILNAEETAKESKESKETKENKEGGA